MKDHLPILILLAPWIAAPLALLVGFFSAFLSRVVALAALVLSFFYCFKCFPLMGEGPWHYSLGGWAPPWGIEMVFSPFACLLACSLLAVLIFALFYSRGFETYGQVGKWNIRFIPPALLLFGGSLLGLLFTQDLFTGYLFLQVSILSSGVLLGLASEKGGLDSFLWVLRASTGASLLLWGLFHLYTATGTLHGEDILAQLYISGDGATALLAGILFAAAWAYPLCFPAPFFFSRILENTPPFILGLLSSTVARTGVFSLFFVYFFVLNVPAIAAPDWMVFVERLLVVLLLGLFGIAVRQKDFLKSVALLSVAQLGYLFAGFLLGNKTALMGTLLELLSQTLGVAGLFFTAGILRANAGGQPFSRMAGLARQRLLTGLSLIVFMASIVGVPPTGGFFGKYYLVLGALEKQDRLLLILLGATILFNLVCFARLLGLLFEHRSPNLSPEPPLSSRAPVLLLAAGILVLGLFHQDVIKNFIEPALPKVFLETPVPNVPFLGKEVE